jgi:opacity protein-like surface antigen
MRMSNRCAAITGALTVAMLFIGGLPSASAEWFGDAYIGGAFTASRDVVVGGTDGTTFRNVDFDSAPVFGARVGYWLGDFEYIGGAVDVAHFRPNIGSQSVRSDFGTMPFSSVDVAVTALSFDALVRYPLMRDTAFPKGRLQPYALFGPSVAFTSVKDTSNFGPPANQSHLSTRLGFNVGAGVLWQLTTRVGVFGEYRHFEVQPTPEFDGGGEVDLKVETNMLNLGVSFRF